jgi:hypothetical protein
MLAAADQAADPHRVADLEARNFRADALTWPTISWPGTQG